MVSRTAKQIGKGPVVPAQVEQENVPLMTMMDTLDTYLAQDARLEPKGYKVPGRPALSLIFDLNIGYEEYDTWSKRVTKKKHGDVEVNMLALANIVISNKNIGITFNGNEEKGSDGEPLTVAHPDLHRMLKVNTGMTNTAIKKLFGNDADVLQMMRRVMEDAGYTIDGDGIEDDPLED